MLLSRAAALLMGAAAVNAATVLTTLRARSKNYDNFVYLIRHGEKPADGSDGLAPAGVLRSLCLVNVFDTSSGFDIGYIMAEQPQSNGDRTRPLLTVTPLANSLGLTVDDSCDRDDSDCVADAVAAFAKNSSQSILICWEHGQLTDIVEALGVKKKNAPDYPDDNFNLIWTLQDQKILDDTQSEDCPGLDD